MDIDNKFSKITLYFYGLGWFLGGLVYAYAGLVAPVLYSPPSEYTPELAAQFIQKLEPYWVYYVIAFTIFTLADTAMMLLGLVFKQLFGVNFHTNTALLCLFSGGFIGSCVDLSLLTCWMLMGTFHLSAEILPSFWSVFLVIQYLGLLLSAWGFLVGALGIYLIYKTSKKSIAVPNSWKKLTLIIF